MTNEAWKIIADSNYKVSSLGRIRNPRGKLIRPFRNGRYLQVEIVVNEELKKFSVHRLVATAFLGAPFEGAQCAHGDNNGLNNAVENLRWATPKENEGDKIKHGTRYRGEGHHLAIFTEKDIAPIYNDPRPVRAIARSLGVSRCAITSIKRRITWKHVPVSVWELAKVKT